MWKKWKQRNCQSHQWQNVEPDPTRTCGPHTSASKIDSMYFSQFFDKIFLIEQAGNAAHYH